MAARTARNFSVTGVLRDNVAGTSFTRVPGLVLTAAQVKAGLLGGRNGAGQQVPGGWHDFICDTCGESAVRCPDLRVLLPVAFIGERIDAEQAA